jgi:hypothetical protein
MYKKGRKSFHFFNKKRAEIEIPPLFNPIFYEKPILTYVKIRRMVAAGAKFV